MSGANDACLLVACLLLCKARRRRSVSEYLDVVLTRHTRHPQRLYTTEGDSSWRRDAATTIIDTKNEIIVNTSQLLYYCHSKKTV